MTTFHSITFTLYRVVSYKKYQITSLLLYNTVNMFFWKQYIPTLFTSSHHTTRYIICINISPHHALHSYTRITSYISIQPSHRYLTGYNSFLISHCILYQKGAGFINPDCGKHTFSLFFNNLYFPIPIH